MLLSNFDIEKGKMQTAFLELKVTNPRTADDYTKSIFSFDADLIHPIDQIDLHKQSGEMIFSTLTNSAMTTYII